MHVVVEEDKSSGYGATHPTHTTGSAKGICAEVVSESWLTTARTHAQPNNLHGLIGAYP